MNEYEIQNSVLSKENQDFDVKRWLFRTLRFWYWFVLSVVACLFAAWLYLHYTNPVYQAVASVMIKDEKKGADISDNTILKDLGINGSKLVENEIEILKSYDLMESVVRKQQLFVQFWAEGRLRDVPLFGKDLPFLLEVLNADSLIASCTWILAYDAGRMKLTTGSAGVKEVKYGEIYFFDGVRFQLFPNDDRRVTHPGDSVIRTGIYNALIMPVPAATGGYVGKLNVGVVSKQASVVSLAIVDPHREKAVKILSTLIDIYNRQGLDDKNKVTSNTIDFLNERLKSVSFDLQNVEGQVQRFKTDHQITDISTDSKLYLDIARDIDMQKAQAQTQFNIVSSLERDLLLHQDSPTLVPSTLGLQDVSLASLVEKHNSLFLEKERIEKNKEIASENPRLIELGQQVQEIRRKLLSNVRSLKDAFEIALNDISRKDATLSGRIRNVPQLERSLLEIQRNRNVQEQLYAFLLQKREEAAVTLASNIPDSRTIVKARGLGQVSPKSKNIWSLAFVIGLLIPMVIMLIANFFNDKVGDAEEIEQKTRVPLLGSISHIKSIQSPIVIKHKAKSAVAEQFRALRTSIGFTGKGKEVKKILITSAQPGDGKSFISINLAASFALLGKKTVVVELDLRKPHIGKYLNITSSNGVSSLLSGKGNLKDVLIEIPDFEKQLFLLPAGYLPPNPAELVSGDQMRKLMVELEKEFDCIVIDTPPFGLVTDAVLLQRYADITLVVLRQGYTRKGVFEQLNQLAAQSADSPVYALLNGIGWKRRYQYGYGSYNAYGYGSGYFDEKDA